MPVSRRRRRRSAQRGRQAEMSIPQSRPRTNIWYIIASGVIAFLVIAGFVVGGISFQGGGDGIGTATEYKEGVGEQQEIMPTRRHVPEEQNVVYNTTPPTSGDHWDWWARCGFYEDGLPDERVVHNMEHGNVIVSYNLPDGPELDKLKGFMDDFELAPSWAVTRFYDQIPEGTVSVHTWGVLDTMQGVDEDRIEEFFRSYAGTLGPEFPNGAPCTTSGVMN